jgi:hypothetical protein
MLLQLDTSSHISSAVSAADCRLRKKPEHKFQNGAVSLWKNFGILLEAFCLFSTRIFKLPTQLFSWNNGKSKKSKFLTHWDDFTLHFLLKDVMAASDALI